MRVGVICCIWIAAALTCDGAGPAAGNLIDEHIFGKMKRNGVPPAPQSSDAEFLRRIYLDLTGHLPEPAEARKFLADSSPDKREKLIQSMFPPLPVTGMRSISTHPFLDQIGRAHV